MGVSGCSCGAAGDGCATYLDGTEVNEEVGGAVLGGDETVSLLVVEPLDGAVLAVGGGGGVHFDGCVWVVLVGGGVFGAKVVVDVESVG
jgi:hypothetical protein